MWLEPAHQRLEEGRPAAALEELIEAWRRRRLPQLADLIGVLDGKLTGALPPIVGKTRAALHHVWLDVVNERRAIDLGRLLAVFQTQPWALVGERIERLARVDDPRVTNTFARFFQALPTSGGLSRAQWSLLFTRLAESADVRVRQALAERLAAPDGRVFVTEDLSPLAQRVVEGLPEVRATAEELGALHELAETIELATKVLPPAAQLLADRTRTADTRSEDELLSVIYESPEDDAPRLVYSDWLQERGSPRAELLLLQLRPRQTKQVEADARRLWKKRGREWMGVLEPAIAIRTEVFERGFLSAGQLHFPTPQLRKQLLGRPEWNTLTSLVGGEHLDAEFLLANELRGVRRLDFLTEDHVQALARRQKPLRSLRQLHVWDVPLAVLGRLSPETVPALTSLDLGVSPVDQRSFEQLLAKPSPLFRALTSIGVRFVHRPSVFRALTTLPNVQTIFLPAHRDTMDLAFHRRPEGWVMDVIPAMWSLPNLEAGLRDFLPLVSGVMEPAPGWKERLAHVRGRIENLSPVRWVPRR